MYFLGFAFVLSCCTLAALARPHHKNHHRLHSHALEERTHLDCTEAVKDICNPFIHRALLFDSVFVSDTAGRTTTVQDDDAVTAYLATSLSQDIVDAMKLKAPDTTSKTLVETVSGERKHALEQCLDALWTTPEAALAPYGLTKLFTFGTKEKFASWGFDKTIRLDSIKFPLLGTFTYRGQNTQRVLTERRQQANLRQSAFVQGRETYLASLDFYFKGGNGPFKTNADKGATLTETATEKKDRIITNNREFIQAAHTLIGTTSLGNSNVELYQNFMALSSDEERLREKPLYYFAAALSLYPMLGELALYLCVDGKDKDLAGFANPTAATKFFGQTLSDEIWDIFKAGVNFGRQNMAYDSTGGVGIYLALEKIGGHGSECLECDAAAYHSTTAKKALNIDTSCAIGACAMKNLIAAGMMKRPYSESDAIEERMMISPSKKNLYTQPALAEKVLHGKLLIFKPDKLTDTDNPYVVDKREINWANCKACE